VAVAIVGMRGVRVPGMRAVIGSGSALFRARRRTFAGETRPRARDRDQPGQNGAKQR